MQYQAFPDTLEEKLKTEADRLGFPICGICKPDPPAHYRTYLQWLDDGCHAGMRYMAEPKSKQLRSDPHLLLPGCQSIISLATPYSMPVQKKAIRKNQGIMAAFAHGKDYHKVITQHLNQLIDYINTQTGTPVKARICVDTSPILEKDYAQEAGLGWIGRNSLLIIPNYGSFFFLGEILLDLPLEPDIPYTRDGCGDCTRCIDACPTQAINPDRTIDARLCLSYLTIEYHGSIPIEMRKPISDRIFGCDTCQQVCPHNRHARLLPGIKELMQPAFNPHPSLFDELMLNEQQFTEKYHGTSISRAKYYGYMRNLLIAIGNAGSPSCLPVLDKFIERMISEAEDNKISGADYQDFVYLTQWVEDNCEW